MNFLNIFLRLGALREIRPRGLEEGKSAAEPIL